MLHTIKNQNYMKQITSFNIARLRVEEDFGFLKLVVAETDCLISDSDSPDEISIHSGYINHLYRHFQKRS